MGARTAEGGRATEGWDGAPRCKVVGYKVQHSWAAYRLVPRPASRTAQRQHARQDEPTAGVPARNPQRSAHLGCCARWRAARPTAARFRTCTRLWPPGTPAGWAAQGKNRWWHQQFGLARWHQEIGPESKSGYVRAPVASRHICSMGRRATKGGDREVCGRLAAIAAANWDATRHGCGCLAAPPAADPLHHVIAPAASKPNHSCSSTHQRDARHDARAEEPNEVPPVALDAAVRCPGVEIVHLRCRQGRMDHALCQQAPSAPSKGVDSVLLQTHVDGGQRAGTGLVHAPSSPSRWLRHPPGGSSMHAGPTPAAAHASCFKPGKGQTVAEKRKWAPHSPPETAAAAPPCPHPGLLAAAGWPAHADAGKTVKSGPATSALQFLGCRCTRPSHPPPSLAVVAAAGAAACRRPPLTTV